MLATRRPSPRSDRCRPGRTVVSTLRILGLLGLAALPALVWTACGRPGGEPGDGTGAGTAADAADSLGPMDVVAEAYVRLVLAVGEHDPDYVDAYYGPPAWRREAKEAAAPLADVRAEAMARIGELAALPDPVGPTGELERLRQRFLSRQLAALVARVDLLGGARLTFDQESQALYDAVAPRYGEERFAAELARLESLLPGEGPLVDRWAAWRDGFVVPPDRLDRVFTAAIDECRRRTKAHIALPDGESFAVEYVTDKPWGAYNWYQGGYHSLIQVNTDLPTYVGGAVDLACHEGYPGHHVYNALLEKNLVRDRRWVEYEVYPLFSPQSLIAEGSAEFGIEMAFPGAERTAFERDVLFPLAGLDPARAEEYGRVRELTKGLAFAGNEAARRYLDGEIDAAAAAAWLEKYALMTAPRAAQRVKFMDKYRSYVINYNLGEELVRGWVEAQAGTAGPPEPPEGRWRAFEALLSTPRLPSELAAEPTAGVR